MKILVIQQKMTGDVLLSSVICQAIKMKYPNAEVHYLVYKNTIDVIQNNPYIDHIIAFDNKKHNNIFSLVAFGKSLQKNKYDAVIDAYGKWEGIIPAWFSNAPKTVGKKKWYTKLFYTHTVPIPKGKTNEALSFRLELAKVVTGQTAQIDFPKIYLTLKEIEAGLQTLQKYIGTNQQAVMISILGSGTSKSLPAPVMAEMLDFIASNSHFALLFNYLPSQATEAKIIFDLCKTETRQKIIFDLYAERLRDFMAILIHCRALIGNEGGAVNIAKALDISTFSVFSPWIPKTLWNMMVDEGKHMAIHIQDYFPELYPENYSVKAIKKNYQAYYKKLSFGLFKKSLLVFLNKIQTGNNSAK